VLSKKNVSIKCRDLEESLLLPAAGGSMWKRSCSLLTKFDSESCSANNHD